MGKITAAKTKYLQTSKLKEPMNSRAETFMAPKGPETNRSIAAKQATRVLDFVQRRGLVRIATSVRVFPKTPTSNMKHNSTFMMTEPRLSDSCESTVTARP